MLIWPEDRNKYVFYVDKYISIGWDSFLSNNFSSAKLSNIFFKNVIVDVQFNETNRNFWSLIRIFIFLMTPLHSCLVCLTRSILIHLWNEGYICLKTSLLLLNITLMCVILDCALPLFPLLYHFPFFFNKKVIIIMTTKTNN